MESSVHANTYPSRQDSLQLLILISCGASEANRLQSFSGVRLTAKGTGSPRVRSCHILAQIKRGSAEADSRAMKGMQSRKPRNRRNRERECMAESSLESMIYKRREITIRYCPTYPASQRWIIYLDGEPALRASPTRQGAINRAQAMIEVRLS